MSVLNPMTADEIRQTCTQVGTIRMANDKEFEDAYIPNWDTHIQQRHFPGLRFLTIFVLAGDEVIELDLNYDAIQYIRLLPEEPPVLRVPRDHTCTVCVPDGGDPECKSCLGSGIGIYKKGETHLGREILEDCLMLINDRSAVPLEAREKIVNRLKNMLEQKR